MTEETLAAALEREHREIDEGIASFVAGLEAGEIRAEPITRAMDALRRHIYLEEAFLFPPMRPALMMPIFVMLREHGDMWRQMDDLAGRVARGDDPAAVRERCRGLIDMLNAHNMKEEAVIYPQVEDSFSTEESDEMRRFLETGSMPDGWSCQGATPA